MELEIVISWETKWFVFLPVFLLLVCQKRSSVEASKKSFDV